MDDFLGFDMFLALGKKTGSPKRKNLFWQTSQLCIEGELAGGGFVAVAAGVGLYSGTGLHKLQSCTNTDLPPKA